ncbi:hypothetical protein SAMN04488168_106148 [Bacillus sp. 491mf]|nr:hypothetical protein SAMN04488168_106148 [Bacillus sp. 491mf]
MDVRYIFKIDTPIVLYDYQPKRADEYPNFEFNK